MRIHKDYTEGPIVRSLISLSIPIILANVLQTAYQLIDTYWVGRLGTEAVAAVSLSFPLNFLFIALGGGLAIAGTVLVAQYRGKQDQESINHVSGQTLLILTIVSFILAVIGYTFAEPIIRLMGAGPDVLPEASAFLRVSFVGLPFMFGFFVYQSLMRGVGDVQKPMYIVLVTVVLNFFLDPLFMYGWGPIPRLGVAGVAWATVLTQAIATIIGFRYLLGGRYGIHIQMKHLRPDFPLITRIFWLGFPASVEQSTRALGLTIMTVLVASFGTVVIASYGIGIRMLTFIIIPAMGLSMAASTIVGQNIGAGRIARAERTAILGSLISWLLLTVIGGMVFLIAPVLSSLFVPGEEAVIAESASFIRIMAFTFGFMGAQQVLTGTLRGSGSTVASMLLSILSLWIIQFPLAYILSKHTPLAEDGIWWAFAGSNILSTLLVGVWFWKGDWKKKKLTEEVKLKEETMEEIIIDEGVQA